MNIKLKSGEQQEFMVDGRFTVKVYEDETIIEFETSCVIPKEKIKIIENENRPK